MYWLMLSGSVLEQSLQSELVLLHTGCQIGSIEISIDRVSDLVLQDLNMFVKLQFDLVLYKWLEHF